MSTSGIVTVKARKAQAIVSPVPSVVIVIDRAMPIARQEKRNRTRQQQDARKLGEALTVSLPIGTLEQLSEFLIDKLRRPVVKSTRHTISRRKVQVTNQE